MTSLSPEEFLRVIMWEPGYDDCVHCSNHLTQVPAAYEFWFELRGDMLLGAWNEPLPEHSVRQSLCVPCAARCRAEHDAGLDDNMPIILARKLR